MQYGDECLIHKFNITKSYFEKVVKNNSIQDFHKFVYDEMIYPYQNKLLPVLFHNRASNRDVAIRRISRKFQIFFNFTSMIILPRFYGSLNIFITPKLYKNTNMSFVRNLKKRFSQGAI